jgi:signal peptidase I
MSNPYLEKKPLPQPVVETALQRWSRAGKQSKFSVIGNSMYPFLLPDDTLIIAHGCENARPGELLAFRQNKTLIVHRLLQIRNDNNSLAYLIKGDNCIQSDPLILANQVVGIVRAIHRGRARVDLSAPTWRIASCAIAASGRLGLVIDRLGKRAKQQLVGPKPNSFSTTIRRTILALFSIPGRVLSWMLWSRS